VTSWAGYCRLIAGGLVLALFGFAPDAQAAVGRTAGTFMVSPTGAGTYTIPIWAPPGPQGVQPHITLSYSSRSGDGSEGVGWTLTGLSSIYRCVQTYAQDNAARGIALTLSDRYCIDGKRLRLTSSETLSTYGADGTTYQTEIADFSTVTAHGSTGSGPASFTMQARNGWVYEYGATPDSQVLGGTAVYVWMLDKVTDPAGNTMVISWKTADANLAGTTVPASISWTPTGHGSTAYEYEMVFNYQPVSLAVQAGYVSGHAISDFYSLSSIQVNYQGSTVKDYFLAYARSPTTGRQTLTSITECADTTESNCLSPTQFTYQEPAEGLGGGATLTSSTSALTGLTAAHDFNGDGRNDLAWYQNGSWQVAFATSSGYSAPISTAITDSTALKESVDGSGTDGFLAQQAGTWWWYKWNGTSFVGTNTTVALDNTTAGSFAIADVNGDGLPDLITTHADGNLYVRVNSSTTGTVKFSTTPIDTMPNPGLISSLIGSRRSDFAGTGRQDIFAFFTLAGGSAASKLLRWNGVSFTVSQAFSGDPVDVADYNDDGCSDLLFPTTLVISACNGSPAQTIALGHTAVAGVDWDGDGRRDVLVANGTTLGVYLSIGTGLSSTLVSTGIPYSAASTYTVARNATGDGLDALVVTSGASPYTVSYYLHNGGGTPPDLLTKIVDGLGNSISPAYVSIAQDATDAEGTAASYPDRNYLGPVYVADTVIYSDPSSASGGTYSQQINYFRAWMNLQGRGFEGFEQTRTHDSRTGVDEHWYYNPAFPYTGMPTQEFYNFPTVTARSIQNTLARTVLDSTSMNQRYFPYISNTTVKHFELGGTENSDQTGTASTSYTFDNNGYPTKVINTTTDNDPGSPYSGDSWTQTITNTPAPGSGCLTLLSESQITYTASDGSLPVTRTTQYTPDTANCRYSVITTEPSSTTYEVTESLGYDTFGNIATDTVTGIGMAARQTTVNWGATGQFPMSVTDALNETTTFTYDFRYGLLSSQTDPNGLPTTWQYADGFGRLTQETRPDKTATQWTYTPCIANSYCPGTSSIEVKATALDSGGAYISDVQTYPDAAGRTIQRFARNLNPSGSYYDFESWQYDSLGRLIRHGLPCLTGDCPASQGFVNYTYDGLDRVIQTQTQSSTTSATSTYAYAGDSTTATDANGNPRTLVHDPNGWLRRTEDATGYTIILGYDAAGSHIGTTDSLNNTLWTGTVQYGTAPFTTAATDADLGAWHYTFDALGELTAWSDAKGQSFSAKYDALSRMTDRYEPDLYSHWTWGTSAGAHEIGRLHSVCTGTGANPTACVAATGYAESESYDGDGRLSQRSIAIPGDTTYSYTWAYSATTGLLDTLAYPADWSGYRPQVKYGYAAGQLQSITDISDSPNVTLWSGNFVDGNGSFTQETLGNGVTVNHDYDPVTGMVKITAGTGGTVNLQNNSYLYDAAGNLEQRQDNNAGTTESVYYDNVNRLKNTAGDTNTNLTYDAMGRLATWEASGASANVNDYTTPQAGCTYYANAQPHALRSDRQGAWPPGSYCYDANGNMTTGSSGGTAFASFSWTSFNQPNVLSAPGYNSSSQFFYDQNHQRFKQIASYSGSAETTEYIGGLMEKMTNSSGTAYRYYIPAGSNSIVYNRWTNGVNALYYMTKDNLDSSAVVTDHAGALVAAQNYAALGWTESSSTAQIAMAAVTRHRFTGQESIDNPGLWSVNMNGRIYVPSGSRFLSADPNIPDPTRTVDYNRYAYAEFNPLTYNDPTGFDDKNTHDKSDLSDGVTSGAGPDGGMYANFSGATCAGNCVSYHETMNLTAEGGNTSVGKVVDVYQGSTQNSSTVLGAYEYNKTSGSWDWDPSGLTGISSFGSLSTNSTSAGVGSTFGGISWGGVGAGRRVRVSAPTTAAPAPAQQSNPSQSGCAYIACPVVQATREPPLPFELPPAITPGLIALDYDVNFLQRTLEALGLLTRVSVVSLQLHNATGEPQDGPMPPEAGTPEPQTTEQPYNPGPTVRFNPQTGEMEFSGRVGELPPEFFEVPF